MPPQLLKYTLDIITILVGVWIMIRLLRSSVGGVVGMSFRLILVGTFVLAINHLIDTAYLTQVLAAMGNSHVLFMAPLIQRIINFIGFMLMALGFKKFADISTKANSSN